MKTRNKPTKRKYKEQLEFRIARLMNAEYYVPPKPHTQCGRQSLKR